MKEFLKTFLQVLCVTPIVIAIVLFTISPIFAVLYVNNQLLAAALIIVYIALMATFIITTINKHNKKNNYGKSL
nr:MAG TPA: Multidrug efflux pump-associated protein AcrZ [Caudoviricetes sp.]